MSGEEGRCAKCPARQQVTWCPAWQMWLCDEHRFERTYRELDATDRPHGWLSAQARDVTVVTL